LSSKNEDVWLNQLMKHLGSWSWLHMLYQYDDTHLLIAGSFFVEHLKRARKKPLLCKTALPSNFDEAITDKIKKVLVFSEHDELAITRKIQREHPHIKVTSGTYGYALTGKDRYPRLKEYKPAKKLEQTNRPVLILSTPYADAEFITNVMAENGLPYFHEYLGRPFATWLLRHRHFQVGRFYGTAEQHYAKNGTLHYLLQTDVLNSVFDNTSFTLKRFIQYLEVSQAKVILVKRRDTIAQALNGQLLNRTLERSVWTKKNAAPLRCKYLPTDLYGSMHRQNHIVEDEKMLDQIAASRTSTLAVCLENFIEDQSSGLADIAAFLGASLGETIETIDYGAGYEKAPNIVRAPDQFRRELIDRVGLYNNSLSNI